VDKAKFGETRKIQKSTVWKKDDAVSVGK